MHVQQMQQLTELTVGMHVQLNGIDCMHVQLMELTVSIHVQLMEFTLGMHVQPMQFIVSMHVYLIENNE